MAKNELQIGDVVKLKSSGQKMTVTAIDTDTVSVIWMNDKNNMKGRSAIHHECLVKADR